MKFEWLGLQLAGGNLVLLIVLLFFSSLFLFLYYYKGLPIRGGSKLRVLPILRASALFLLILLFFDPLLHLLFPRKDPPLLPILVDTSRSMSLPVHKGNSLDSSTRIKEVEQLLQEGPMQELKSKGETPIWGFSKTLEKKVGDSLSAEGNATDIGSALEEVKKAVGGEIAALFLFSDGRNTLGADPVRVAREGGFPIYVVEIGSSSQQGDIAIERVRVNDVVYAGDRVPVEVFVETMGLGGGEGRIVLQEKGRVLDEVQIRLTEERAKQTKVLYFVPNSPGFHTYQVLIEPVEGEVSRDNNRRTFACEVLKSKIQPLIIAGSPSWNLSFLKNSLARDDKFDPALYIRLKEGLTLYQKSGLEKKASLPIQGSLANDYDCVVLIDVGMSPPQKDVLPLSFLRLLEEFVSEGGGLLFLSASFSPTEK